MEFRHALKEWMINRWPSWSEGTRRSMETHQRLWLAAFGPTTDLARLTLADVQKYEMAIAAKNQASTVNKLRTALRMFFKHAVEERWMKRDLTHTWRTRKVDPGARKLIRFPPGSEEQIKPYLPENIWRFIVFLVNTSLRFNSAAAVRWEWVEGRMLHVPAEWEGKRIVKTNESLDIPLNPTAIEVMGPPKATGLVFDLPCETKIRKHWRRAIAKLGLSPRLRVHDLRGEMGTRILESGIGNHALARQIGGWKNTSVFERRYEKDMLNKLKQNAVDKVDAWTKSGTPEVDGAAQSREELKKEILRELLGELRGEGKRAS